MRHSVVRCCGLCGELEEGNGYCTPHGCWGDGGAFQEERRVYARGGLAGYSCSTPIKKTVIAQRGTHYCPQCQR